MQHVIAWQYVIVNNTGVLHTMANIFVTLSKSRRHIALQKIVKFKIVKTLLIFIDTAKMQIFLNTECFNLIFLLFTICLIHTKLDTVSLSVSERRHKKGPVDLDKSREVCSFRRPNLKRTKNASYKGTNF